MDREDKYEQLEDILEDKGFPLDVYQITNSYISYGRSDLHYEIRIGVRGKPPVEIRIDFESRDRDQNIEDFQILANKCYVEEDSSMTSETNIGAIIFTSETPMSIDEIAEKLEEIYEKTYDIIGLDP